MSRFLNDEYKNLVPYTPGEQPQDKKYIKLNTNESPFPPSPFAMRMAREEGSSLQLYSDPDCKKLINVAAEKFDTGTDNIVFTNGSDEVLDYIMKLYCKGSDNTVFSSVTYGFYKVIADVNKVKYQTIEMNDDLSINVDAFLNINRNIFIANPNAQTGTYIRLSDIEKIVKSNPDNIVVIDEAYVDFGNESAINLTRIYDNLIVTRTFSKSYSLAGARLGFAVANSEIIKDINTLRFSVNPYNVNRMTMMAGIGSLIDEEYFKDNIRKILENKKYLEDELSRLGFTFTDSKSNFVLAKKEGCSGEKIYKDLKEKGILVRHFKDELIKDYIRITIGSKEELSSLISTLEMIL